LHYLWFVMCEFNVIIGGKIQFRDVIYVRVDGENVTVKNILGQAQEFKGYKILEVDVPNTRLVLLPIKE
jgi:predicted RNA-binding protein